MDQVVQSADSKGNYPSIYGVLSATLGLELKAALVAAKALAFGGNYLNLPQTVFTPDWGTWVWTQNPDGSWQYPPVWKELTPFTDANPATSKDLGGLILATHISQYSRFFNMVPAPRMPVNQQAQEAAEAKKRALIAAARLHG